MQEYRICAKDGRTRWISDHKTSIFDSEGSFISIDGIAYDISEHKEFEEKLRESEKEKTLILDNTVEIIAYYDISCCFQWANKAYQKATGLSLEELKGQICYQAWGLDKFCI